MRQNGIESFPKYSQPSRNVYEKHVALGTHVIQVRRSRINHVTTTAKHVEFTHFAALSSLSDKANPSTTTILSRRIINQRNTKDDNPAFRTIALQWFRFLPFCGSWSRRRRSHQLGFDFHSAHHRIRRSPVSSTSCYQVTFSSQRASLRHRHRHVVISSNGDTGERLLLDAPHVVETQLLNDLIDYFHRINLTLYEQCQTALATVLSTIQSFTQELCIATQLSDATIRSYVPGTTLWSNENRVGTKWWSIPSFMVEPASSPPWLTATAIVSFGLVSFFSFGGQFRFQQQYSITDTTLSLVNLRYGCSTPLLWSALAHGNGTYRTYPVNQSQLCCKYAIWTILLQNRGEAPCANPILPGVYWEWALSFNANVCRHSQNPSLSFPCKPISKTFSPGASQVTHDISFPKPFLLLSTLSLARTRHKHGGSLWMVVAKQRASPTYKPGQSNIHQQVDLPTGQSYAFVIKSETGRGIYGGRYLVRLGRPSKPEAILVAGEESSFGYKQRTNFTFWRGLQQRRFR